MTYDSRLAKDTFTKRRPAPEPGTPEANPAATLIEPKARVGGRWFRRRDPDDPALWVAVSATSHGDGRRSPGARVVVRMPMRSRVVRRTVGTADRYAGGTVRGSDWNNGWRWWMQMAAACYLILMGWSMLVMGAGLIGLLD
jgi:hypothetical protein